MNEELPPLQPMLGARVGVHWDWRTSPVGYEGECVSEGTTKDDLRRGDVAVGVGGVT